MHMTPASPSASDARSRRRTLALTASHRQQFVRAAWRALTRTGVPLVFSVASVIAIDSDAWSEDFQTRCQTPGVLRCIGFDQASDIAETEWGANTGIDTGGASIPMLDSSVKASGNSSLKFTIPSNSGANTSGAYWANFSADLLTQFGGNSDLYVQWRQRFSSELLNAYYTGSNGWKQAAITTGDQPGRLYSSCEALGVTMQNTNQRGFTQMYHSCTGSTSHGAYDAFEQSIHLPSPYNRDDILLQNARPAPYCTYVHPNGYFPPGGNCFAYFPNEWMTFQIHIQVGPRGSAGVAGASPNDEFVNSHIDVWVAREGQPSELVFNWGPYNLSAGTPDENQRYGKIYLLPYQTNKDSSQSHPTAYTWYDELIISRTRIPDPGSASSPPTAPSNLSVK